MLNDAIDPRQLHAEFRQRGRVVIPEILQPEAAQRLHRCLATEVPWTLAYVDADSGSTTVPAGDLAELDAEGRQRIERSLAQTGERQFQFLYNSYMMLPAYLEGRDRGLVLHRLTEWLNSGAFLGLVREVTGVQAVIKADAQATRYRAGHFLRLHTDEEPDSGREVAYVLNLTTHWRADWGGLLCFLDPEGNVVETIMPRFNSLCLFRVPQDHLVTYVAPYARGDRYAITGWARSR